MLLNRLRFLLQSIYPSVQQSRVIWRSANEEEPHPDALTAVLYLSPRFKHCFIPLDSELDYGIDRKSVRDFDKTTSLADFGDSARNARLGDGVDYFDGSDKVETRN